MSRKAGSKNLSILQEVPLSNEGKTKVNTILVLEISAFLIKKASLQQSKQYSFIHIFFETIIAIRGKPIFKKSYFC